MSENTRIAYVFDHERFIDDCRCAVGRRNQMKRVKRIVMEDIAAEIGISRAFLYLMRRGENFSLHTYLDICNELHLNPAAYFKAVALSDAPVKPIDQQAGEGTS